MLAVVVELIIEMVWALTLQDLVGLVAEEMADPTMVLQDSLQLVKVMEETQHPIRAVAVAEHTTLMTELAVTAVRAS
jgi:hypothetical protein